MGKKKILFVDGDYFSFILLSEVLDGDIDVDLTYCECGRKAIDYIDNYDNIALVITELKLSHCNGFSILRKVKAINHNIPVIVQTANILSGVKEECLKAGFDEYFSKPVDVFLLANKIKEIALEVK